MSFELDPRLKADTFAVDRLPLSHVLLMNDARYPWCILVPGRPGITEVFDLSELDQGQFWREATIFARELRREVAADKMNVATLGNVVPQLHLHVIARFQADDAWPGPVWGRHAARPYGAEDQDVMMGKVTAATQRTQAAL